MSATWEEPVYVGSNAEGREVVQGTPEQSSHEGQTVDAINRLNRAKQALRSGKDHVERGNGQLLRGALEAPIVGAAVNKWTNSNKLGTVAGMAFGGTMGAMGLSNKIKGTREQRPAQAELEQALRDLQELGYTMEEAPDGR